MSSSATKPSPEEPEKAPSPRAGRVAKAAADAEEQKRRQMEKQAREREDLILVREESLKLAAADGHKPGGVLRAFSINGRAFRVNYYLPNPEASVELDLVTNVIAWSKVVILTRKRTVHVHERQ